MSKNINSKGMIQTQVGASEGGEAVDISNHLSTMS